MVVALQPEAKTCGGPTAEGREVPVVLVVDDQPVERLLVGKIVERLAGLRTVHARDGREALDRLAETPVALVLTDLQMPEMNGLELVEAVRERYAQVPVVLMTAFGSEDVAVRALRAGAASYVPKRALERELAATLRQVLAVAEAAQTRQRLLSCLERHESVFELESDPELIAPLIDRFLQNLTGMHIGDATARMRIGVALQEAIANALFHGNLEVSSDLRQEDEREFYDLARRRRSLEPYRSRTLEIRAALDKDGATFVIRDEGPGFDVASLERPIDPEDLTRIGGRGLLLIRTFMDQVAHSPTGNEITLVKRRNPSA
ncbi:response regulator [Paludisphaera soli]|uniref:response regulator n=1 Tax=Paludisphaera soli TaxID=2712865 RepID=UPI00198060BC|nr:response regulator [Paludisphaera soli]